MPSIGPISAAPTPDLWVGPFDPRTLAAGGAVAPATASKALFYAFTVHAPVTVGHANILVGTQSGNVDLGIYDTAGNRLASTGSTACGDGSAVQTIALTASITLIPGVVYWAAFCADNTSAAFFTSGSLPGFNNPGFLYRTLTSFPLPISVTPVPNTADRLFTVWFTA